MIFDTLKLGVFAVTATTLLAYPLALLFRGVGPRTQRVLLFIILMPLLTSAQLSMLIDGVDWRAPERQWRPAVAG